MERIILATTSSHRVQAFANLRYDFDAEGSGVDEKFVKRPSNPGELVLLLSRMKACRVADKYKDKSSIVVGFDSVAYHDKKILEKPLSKEEAFVRLVNLSGNRGRFYTGIHIVDISTGRCVSEIAKTEFTLRRLDEGDILDYLDLDSSFSSYALGFNPNRGLSSIFIQEINGSYNNILYGLPLERMPVLLERVCNNNHGTNKLDRKA